MRTRIVAFGLAALLARTATAQVPLSTDTPTAEPPNAAPEAPAPPVVPSSTPSGTTLPAPPPPRLEPKPSVAPPPVTPTPTALPPLERRRPDIGVLTGGLSALVAGYVADIGFTYGYDHHPASTSLIPIVGPWLQLRQHYGLDGPPIDSGSSDTDMRAKQTVDSGNSTIRGLAFAGEIACGIVQATGLVMVVTGAILKGKPRRHANGRTGTSTAPLARIQPNGSFLLRF